VRLNAAKVLKSTVVGKPFQAFITRSQKRNYDYRWQDFYIICNHS